MPTIGDDGKELSGAEKARRRLAKEQELIDAEEAEIGDDRPKWSLEFDKAGDPDLEEFGLGLGYVRKLQMIVIKQMAVTPFPGPAQRETWKRIQAMAATIGMTHSKAGVESEVKAIKAMLADRRQATTFVAEIEGSKVAKPATARGQRRGGPRPIPQDALPPEPSFDSPDQPDEEPEDEPPSE